MYKEHYEIWVSVTVAPTWYRCAARRLHCYGKKIILSLMNEYTVTISFDDEAQKWFARNDDIPILLEDYSIDTLISRVKLAAPEMLEINNMPHTGIHLIFKMEAQAVMA